MKKRIWKGVFLGVMIVGLVTIALAVTITPAAALPPSKAETDCAVMGGTWIDAGLNSKCINVSDPSQIGQLCFGGADGDLVDIPVSYGGPVDLLVLALHNATCHFAPTVVSAPTYGMERKGICKLMDIEDASLGGTVTAIIKGKPNTLKLKADGKTYVLPVVPGSVVANGDGTYTAQFYTIDPETGQALVPAGDYTVRCHGENGSKDGGSANTVTIGY